MKTLFATTALCLALAPLTAAAQTFTVLPVERDARVDASERMAAFSAVQSARVLGPSAQFEPVGQLVHRLPDDQQALASCLEVDCAAHLARQANLDAVLVVAVWPAADGSRAGSVAVTIVDPTGVTHEADAEVGDAGVAQAATSAVVAAARQRNLGDGVELRVDSQPQGALVLLDGTEVGVTPYVATHEPGEHHVEVRLHGESQERDVVLEQDPVEISVALGAASNGDERNGDGGHGRSAGSILIPVGLGVAGLGAGAVAIVGAASGTTCDATTCTRPNTGAIIGWAIAGTVLLASAIVLWFALDDSEPGQGAALGLGPTGAQLRLPVDL